MVPGFAALAGNSFGSCANFSLPFNSFIERVKGNRALKAVTVALLSKVAENVVEPILILNRLPAVSVELLPLFSSPDGLEVMLSSMVQAIMPISTRMRGKRKLSDLVIVEFRLHADF